MMRAPADLSAISRGMRRLWLLVISLVLAGGVCGYLLSTGMTKVYEATTTFLVGEALRSTNVGIDEVKASQSMAQTYADIVRRQPVLEGAIAKLRLPTTWLQLRERVRVDLPPNNTQLIVVTVEARSAAEAESIAGEIGNQLLARSPKRGTTQAQQFVLGQLVALQKKIQAGQARAAALEADLAKATSQDVALVRWRIDTMERMLSGWQDNYSSLSGLIPTTGAAAALEVHERPYASPLPIRPRPRVNAMLGAVIGAMVAMAVAYVAELRPGTMRPAVERLRRLRRRRSSQELPSPGPDETAPQVEVTVPDRVP